MNGHHVHDFERDRTEWDEEIRIWTFEQHGFTPARASSSPEHGRAPVVPLVNAGARPHLRLIHGGKAA